MYKIILALSDALRYNAAIEGMGYLCHLVEVNLASLYKISGELPSMSRPMYGTIHTGLPAGGHGIVANSIARISTKPNIFRSVKDVGKVTAAVGRLVRRFLPDYLLLHPWAWTITGRCLAPILFTSCPYRLETP